MRNLRTLGKPKPANRILFHDDYDGPAGQRLIGRTPPVALAPYYYNESGNQFTLDGIGNLYFNGGGAGENNIRAEMVESKGIVIETCCATFNAQYGIIFNAFGFIDYFLALPNTGSASQLWQQVGGVYTMVASSSTLVDMTKPWYVEISADGDTVLLKDYAQVVAIQYTATNRPLKNASEAAPRSFGSSGAAAFKYFTARRL